MKRREFISSFVGGAAFFPLSVHAQQADRVLVDTRPQPELGAPIFPFAKDYQPAPDIVFRVGLHHERRRAPAWRAILS